jgi:hypothetical protein
LKSSGDDRLTRHFLSFPLSLIYKPKTKTKQLTALKAAVKIVSKISLLALDYSMAEIR